MKKTTHTAKKLTIGQIQKKLWKEVRRVILDIYKKKDGTWECYTCDAKNLVGANCQCGHLIPRSICGAYLRFDLRNIRIQCWRCNINAGGNGAIFLKRLIEREGQEYADQLFRDKQITCNAHDRYLEQLEEYLKM